MDFETWLSQASEEDLRAASEFVWHYPTTIKVYPSGFPDGEPVLEHVCGCKPGYGYKFGEGKHAQDIDLAVMCAIITRELLKDS